MHHRQGEICLLEPLSMAAGRMVPETGAQPRRLAGAETDCDAGAARKAKLRGGPTVRRLAHQLACEARAPAATGRRRCGARGTGA